MSDTERFEYLVIADCDHCGQEVKYVEAFDEPVSVDQDVSIKWAWCPYCRAGPPMWDVKEEVAIDRVPPIDERGEAVTECKWCDGQMYRDGSSVVCGSCGRSKLA